MANKKFLENMRNKAASDASLPEITRKTNVSTINYDDEESFDLGSLGKEIFKNEPEHTSVPTIEPSMKVPDTSSIRNKTVEDMGNFTKEVEKSLEEDFNCVGTSKPIDLSSLPKIESLNVEDEVMEEVKIEPTVEVKDQISETAQTIAPELEVEHQSKPQPKRGRGRPRMVRKIEKQIEEEKLSPNSKESIEDLSEEKISDFNSKQFNALESNDVALKVLRYVCIKLIKNLLENYKSKMYTSEYTEKLFKQYIDGEVNSSNPLFKELISECIESNAIDPYLNDLTIDVLQYIKERE